MLMVHFVIQAASTDEGSDRGLSSQDVTLCQHGAWTPTGYVCTPICRHPAYVLNRLGQLSGATGENAVETVCQLLYLSTLMRLYLQNSKDLSKRGE